MLQRQSDGPRGINTDAVGDKVAFRVSSNAKDDIQVGLDSEVHARVLRKLDWHVLPLVSLLYFLSFLDRTNIATARIAGMGKDLNLVGLRYNTAAAVFYITYCLCQPPSNVILKLFRPSRWIPFIMVIWGLIMTLMCLVKTYHQLLVARLFLGLAEAGLFPGVAYYISLWYPRLEQGKRLAIWSSAASVAGAFGGVLAYAIAKMEGIGGLHGWQWIFCLEGIVTVLVAFAAFGFMSDFPETASFLTDAERCYVVGVMRNDTQGLATYYNSQFVLQALKDYKIYLQFLIFFGFLVPAIAITLFTPTIIHELGFTAANAELLSVAPSAAASVSTVIAGICSDKYRLRGPFVVGGAIVGLMGCAVLYTQAKPGVGLVGVVLIAMGIPPGLTVTLAWVSANAGGDIKRGVAIAIVTGFGQFGGIIGSFIFFDPPRFHVGLGICMGLLGLSLLLSLVLMWDFNRINKQKERLCNEGRITDDQKDKFIEDGDDSPLFRYII